MRCGVALGVAVPLLSASAAHAATFRVTRYDDATPASCMPGNCTLRGAVQAAAAAAGSNKVLAPAGVYSLKYPGTPLVVINATVTIDGVRGQAIIDADGTVGTGTRALDVGPGSTVTLDHVDVRDGISPNNDCGTSPNQFDCGGGIRVYQGGKLTMSNGSVYGNTLAAVAAEGAGIYNGGTLKLHRVVVVDNFTENTAFGGGLFSIGKAVVDESEFGNNQGSFGGGIVNDGGDLTVTRTLLRDNIAGDGGAAYLYGCGASRFTYDTFAGNEVSDHGGAIRNHDSSVFLTHDTISGNQAGTDGGGIAFDNFNVCPTDLFIRDTILAGNSAPSSPDCISANNVDNMTSQGHNIVGDETGCGLTPTTGDRFGTGGSPVNPLLGPLHNNGGPTWTMALEPGSPAIGGADTGVFCGPTDQRGFVIAHDGDHGCDIGAYEVFYPPSPTHAPSISGKHKVGALLACSTGKWAGATPLHFAFRWLRNGHPIAGATTSHHKVVAGDSGKKLRCQVTASNIAGSAKASSSAVKIS